MATTLPRRVARKSGRDHQRTIAQETRRKLFLEALEDRRLLAGLEEPLVSGESSVVRGPWSVANDQGQRTTDDWQLTTDNWQQTTDNRQRTTDNTRELVIVDAAAPNYMQLLQDVIQNPDGTRRFEALLIEPGGDGVAAIGQILAQYRDVDAVHIISHGRAGEVKFRTPDIPPLILGVLPCHGHKSFRKI